MSVSTMTQAAGLRAAFDIIEEAYEYMLAYAAQGRKHEHAEGSGESQIRQHIRRFQGALTDAEAALGEEGFGADGVAFTQRFRDDLAATRAVLALLQANPSVSSEMVDNTNGLITIRALLTDIFFIDQVVLPKR